MDDVWAVPRSPLVTLYTSAQPLFHTDSITILSPFFNFNSYEYFGSLSSLTVNVLPIIFALVGDPVLLTLTVDSRLLRSEDGFHFTLFGRIPGAVTIVWTVFSDAIEMSDPEIEFLVDPLLTSVRTSACNVCL